MPNGSICSTTLTSPHSVQSVTKSSTPMYLLPDISVLRLPRTDGRHFDMTSHRLMFTQIVSTIEVLLRISSFVQEIFLGFRRTMFERLSGIFYFFVVIGFLETVGLDWFGYFGGLVYFWYLFGILYLNAHTTTFLLCYKIEVLTCIPLQNKEFSVKVCFEKKKTFFLM